MGRLEISRTSVSDLSPLAGMSELKTFILYETVVHDLVPLSGMTKLTLLNLRGTCVSTLSPLAEIPDVEILLDESQKIDVPQALMARVWRSDITDVAADSRR